MKYSFTLLTTAITLLMSSCTDNRQQEFMDGVASALENGGKVKIEDFEWTRMPKDFNADGDTLTVTTYPHTDLWQRTYYHFRNDNAPVLQMKTKEKYFSFVVKTDFTQSHHLRQYLLI